MRETESLLIAVQNNDIKVKLDKTNDIKAKLDKTWANRQRGPRGNKNEIVNNIIGEYRQINKWT